MSWGNPDVYYQPEKFDLKPLAEIDYSDGCYQFDIRCVWRHEPSGKLYTARDSGCSCPSPFEDFTSLESLEDFDLAALEAEIAQERSPGSWQSSWQGPQAYTNFLRAIRRATKSG